MNVATQKGGYHFIPVIFSHNAEEITGIFYSYT